MKKTIVIIVSLFMSISVLAAGDGGQFNRDPMVKRPQSANPFRRMHDKKAALKQKHMRMLNKARAAAGKPPVSGR